MATAVAQSQWASTVVVQLMAGQQQQRNDNCHKWQQKQWETAMVGAR
jgi:hypothetical protein